MPTNYWSYHCVVKIKLCKFVLSNEGQLRTNPAEMKWFFCFCWLTWALLGETWLLVECLWAFLNKSDTGSCGRVTSYEQQLNNHESYLLETLSQCLSRPHLGQFFKDCACFSLLGVFFERSSHCLLCYLSLVIFLWPPLQTCNGSHFYSENVLSKNFKWHSFSLFCCMKKSAFERTYWSCS